MSDADRLLEGEITMSQRVISQKTYVQENVLRSALWRAALGSAPDPIPVNEIPQIFASRNTLFPGLGSLGIGAQLFFEEYQIKNHPRLLLYYPKKLHP